MRASTARSHDAPATSTSGGPAPVWSKAMVVPSFEVTVSTAGTLWARPVPRLLRNRSTHGTRVPADEARRDRREVVVVVPRRAVGRRPLADETPELGAERAEAAEPDGEADLGDG